MPADAQFLMYVIKSVEGSSDSFIYCFNVQLRLFVNLNFTGL